MAGYTGGASLPGQPGGWRARLIRWRTGLRGGAAVPVSAPMRPRRPISGWLLHVPTMLRALVRTDEVWLVVLAACAGLAAGLSVTALGMAAQGMHEVLYGLPG